MGVHASESVTVVQLETLELHENALEHPPGPIVAKGVHATRVWLREQAQAQAQLDASEDALLKLEG